MDVGLHDQTAVSLSLCFCSLYSLLIITLYFPAISPSQIFVTLSSELKISHTKKKKKNYGPKLQIQILSKNGIKNKYPDGNYN
jgi:hypothetical protein